MPMTSKRQPKPQPAAQAGRATRNATGTRGDLSPTPIVLACMIAMAGAILPSAHAQQAGAGSARTALAAQRQIDLPAQPLGQTLSALAREWGVSVLMDSALDTGKTAPAVRGHVTLGQALDRALAGSGLAATPSGSAITVHRGATQESATLAPVVVTAQAERSGITEGTNSYTTPVTSTATKMNLSIRETPQSISVVTRQRMDDQELTSITKVLEQTPGVTISRDSGERYIIYSRGSDISKYQFDGVTTLTESSTQNLPQQLADMAIYDKIEVVRGATGLLTGAGVPSGVVNLVRKRPTKDFQASVEGSVGRWNDYRGQFDISGPLIESGRLRARLVGAKQDNDTFTNHYSQKRDVLYGVVEADVTDSTTVRFGVDYSKYEVVGGTGVPVFYKGGEQTRFPRSTSVTSKHQNEQLETRNYIFNIDQNIGNDWKLVVAGNYMDVERDLSNSLVLAGNRGNGVNKASGDYRVARLDGVVALQDQRSAAINLQGPFSLLGRNHQAVIGYEFSRYKNKHKAYGVVSDGTSNLYDPNTITNEQIWGPDGDLYMTQSIYIRQRGYYAALRLNPVEKLHLITGLRVSDYIYDQKLTVHPFNSNGRTSYSKRNAVTPYAGLTYDLTPEQSVYASYTDIFTPNNVKDVNGKVIDPQVGANYELGWKGEFYDGKLNANAAIYHIKRDNATVLDGYHSSGDAYYRAIDGMKTQGIDLEISGEVLPGWNVGASYNHSRSKDADGVKQAVEHPVNSVKLWNTYRFSGNLQGLTIGGGARWQSKISTEPITISGINYEATQGSYVVVDLMVRYKFNRNLSAALNIGNIFDKKYYSSLGSLAYAYYGAPRNVRLGVRYDF